MDQLPPDFFGSAAAHEMSDRESEEESDHGEVEFWPPPGPQHASQYVPGPFQFGQFPPQMQNAYFHPQGFHYLPVPPGMAGAGYFPDGPVASFGEEREEKENSTPVDKEKENSTPVAKEAEHLLDSSEVGRDLVDSVYKDKPVLTMPFSVSYQDFENKVFNGCSMLQEVTGPSVGLEVATTVAQIWVKGRAPKVVKRIREEFPRPENVPEVKKSALNEMILNNIPKSYKAKDAQAANIQSDLVGSAMPLIQIVDGLKQGELKDKPDRVVQMAFSSLSLISAANAQLNQMRRDTIKPALNSKYRVICTDPVKSSDTLFGDDLPTRCEQAQTASALAQKITASSSGRGRGQSQYRGGRGARGGVMRRTRHLDSTVPMGTMVTQGEERTRSLEVRLSVIIRF